MTKWLPQLGILTLGLVVSGPASAQTSALVHTHTASQYGAPAGQPPPPPAPSMAPGAVRPAPPSGRWVYLAEHGWVWTPANARAVNFEGVPYAFLYTPTFGWTWYVSPWGWGPYRAGTWVNRPWHPQGARFWVAPRPVVVGLQHWR